MLSMLSNPIVVVLFVAAIVIGGLFVLSRFGVLGGAPPGNPPNTGRGYIPPAPKPKPPVTGGSGNKDQL